jgi:hypothetical protein
MKSPTNMPLGRRVTETRLDGVVVFPGITRIDQAGWIGWIEFDVAAAQCLQVTIARGQFPSPVLLKETDRRDVLIVAGGPIPPIKRITIQPEPRPTEMLARKQFGFDGRRTQPRRKRYILVVGARQDCARTKRQGWNPSAIAVCFIEQLVSYTEGVIHQACSRFDFTVRKIAPSDRCSADVQVQRPSFS